MTLRFLSLVLVLAALTAQSPVSASPGAGDQAMVDCKLPPQIRSLGRNMTYLAAGRQVRIAAADCKIRGGSYDGRGPGSRAGHELAGDAVVNGRSVVMVGGDQSRAACPGSGQVTGISQGGTLSVRAGPSTSTARVDSLSRGSTVFMCDWTADGAWVGVIYGGGASADCGVADPLTPARAYDGRCKSGWVSAKYLE